VCEKSDGQRVLVLIVVPPMTMVQEVYLIDRKNNYYRVYDLFFPHHDPNSPEAQQTGGQRNHTLLDGELVVDRIGPQQTKLRLLLFDCIVLEHISMAERPLSRRYGRLLDFVFPPYAKYLEHNKSAATSAPFEYVATWLALFLTPAGSWSSQWTWRTESRQSFGISSRPSSTIMTA